jgi:hypothetical protein
MLATRMQRRVREPLLFGKLEPRRSLIDQHVARKYFIIDQELDKGLRLKIVKSRQYSLSDLDAGRSSLSGWR